MVEREEKVLLSADQLGRVAIVKRSDGHFCLYSWWHWSVEAQQRAGFLSPKEFRWTTDYDPSLYYDPVHEIETSPEPSIFECMEDAEAEARRLLRVNGS